MKNGKSPQKNEFFPLTFAYRGHTEPRPYSKIGTQDRISIVSGVTEQS